MGSNRTNRRSAWPFIAIIVLVVLLGMFFARKYIGREPPPKPIPPTQQEGVRSVVLLFAAPDGSGLVREAHEIDPCNGIVECSEEIVSELINGPLGDLSPTLPENATFHGVSVTGDVMTIDFGTELKEGIPNGSSAEMTAIYSVVDTMALNFPQIKLVRFTVEGQPIDTLKGHLDLSEPLAPDFSLEKKPDLPAAPAAPNPKRSQQ